MTDQPTPPPAQPHPLWSRIEAVISAYRSANNGKSPSGAQLSKTFAVTPKAIFGLRDGKMDQVRPEELARIENKLNSGPIEIIATRKRKKQIARDNEYTDKVRKLAKHFGFVRASAQDQPVEALKTKHVFITKLSRKLGIGSTALMSLLSGKPPVLTSVRAKIDKAWSKIQDQMGPAVATDIDTTVAATAPLSLQQVQTLLNAVVLPERQRVIAAISRMDAQQFERVRGLCEGMGVL